MTDLRNQKRLASEILKCGRSRVWIDPLHADEVAEAVTRQDVRALVRQGRIRKQQAQGVSRGRARALQRQKDKGRRKGPGSRKGAKGAREPKKARWMKTIRPIRRTLRVLRDTGHLDPSDYRVYYRQAKGGVFRSKAHLVSHLKMDGVLAADLDVAALVDAPATPVRPLAPEEDLDGAGTDTDDEEDA